MRQRTLFGGLAIIVLAVIVIFAVTRYTGSSSPAGEAAFISGMQPIMAQTNNPANFQTLETQRASMICKTISGLAVTDWVGTVDKVDTTVSGGALLSISVMQNVDFGTAPNSTLNAGSNTLIPQDSPLYHTVSTLQPGQKIRFSGTLFSSATDCIQESSVTVGGSMTNPLFLIKFTSLTPLS
jgi:hypothetical protein